jgi:hypothetical protein
LPIDPDYFQEALFREDAMSALGRMGIRMRELGCDERNGMSDLKSQI